MLVFCEEEPITKPTIHHIPMLENVVKKMYPYFVDGMFRCYITSTEVVTLYEHGASLPLGWDIETTKRAATEQAQLHKKVIFWFKPSKEIREEYDLWMQSQEHLHRKNDDFVNVKEVPDNLSVKY